MKADPHGSESVSALPEAGPSAFVSTDLAP
jgi:hypothetical protein